MAQETMNGTNIPLECLNDTLKEVDKMVKAHEDILECSQHLFRMYIGAGKTASEALGLIVELNQRCADKARKNKGAIEDGQE